MRRTSVKYKFYIWSLIFIQSFYYFNMMIINIKFNLFSHSVRHTLIQCGLSWTSIVDVANVINRNYPQTVGSNEHHHFNNLADTVIFSIIFN